MKKIQILIILSLFVVFLSGCNNIDKAAENIKQLELTGNLVTYEAYYHNVVFYEKEAGKGIFHLGEKNRKLFAEYTGTIKYGINLSDVKFDAVNGTINVVIPKAILIGEPNVDKNDFNSENFIEDKDSINSNPITVEDSSKAFELAQNNIKEDALNNVEVLQMAQKRARIVIEEQIKQFMKSDDDLHINWEYE